MKKYLATFLLFINLVSPVVVLAQGADTSCPDDIGNISDVLNLAGCIIKRALIPLLVLLSTVVFIIGVIKYISGADDSAKREDGRKFMIYGIIALFVMISFWGIVAILRGTFGVGNSVLIPQLQEV